jgi:hypothetical protein
MLAGGLFTDLFAVESHMRLGVGDTKNYSEDARRKELAVIDTTDNGSDQVTAIPRQHPATKPGDRSQEPAIPNSR